MKTEAKRLLEGETMTISTCTAERPEGMWGGERLGYYCSAMWVQVKDAWSREQSLTQLAKR